MTGINYAEALKPMLDSMVEKDNKILSLERELEESNRLLSEDRKQIFELGKENSALQRERDDAKQDFDTVFKDLKKLEESNGVFGQSSGNIIELTLSRLKDQEDHLESLRKALEGLYNVCCGDPIKNTNQFKVAREVLNNGSPS